MKGGGLKFIPPSLPLSVPVTAQVSNDQGSPTRMGALSLSSSQIRARSCWSKSEIDA